jgi:hypothetical protein
MLYQLSYSRPPLNSHTCDIHANFVARDGPVVAILSLGVVSKFVREESDPTD